MSQSLNSLTLSTFAAADTSQSAPLHTAVEQHSPLLTLAEEMLLNILGNLDLQGVRASSLVCRQLKSLTEDSSLWRNLFRRDFRGLPNTDNAKEAYKNGYILHSNLANAVYSLRALIGHRDAVCNLVIADGLLFSRASDKTIKVWDVTTGEALRTLEGHTGPVYCLCVADGLLFSGSFDRTIKIWDLRSDQCLRTLVNTETVTSLIVADGLLIAGSSDGTIRFWNYQTGEFKRSLVGHTRSVVSLHIDNGQLFSRDDNNVIRIWDIKTGEALRAIERLPHIRSFIVADGKLIVAFTEGKIKICDQKTENILRTLVHSQQVGASIFRLAFADEKLFSVSTDGLVKIWDIKTGEALSTLEWRNWYSLAFADGKLALGSFLGGIQIMDFMASDHAIFAEIAGLLRSKQAEVVRGAIDRFSRMPKKARDKVYQELHLIFKASNHDYSGNAKAAFHDEQGESSTPKQKAHAIVNYLATQGIATAADPAEYIPPSDDAP